ncbi:helix-turn-helix domain-containing protein [Qipengyuania sp. GH25]|uniref:Helix-turn-helix domain-containing protein n=1 Tax=Qipengyuania pacifica TaxID=2860199 RepID=A0ABS7JFQ1_9SPHN|nr:helix-turn-helix domain-containing protein [Qipengyuania aerophila]MBX7488847.1 helix-turn-helix domain-containing protein [Qipengyuania aerophila]
MHRSGNPTGPPASAPRGLTVTRPYSPATLAARWECSTTLIYDLLNAGTLKGFRIGKLWRIPTDAIEEYETSPSTGTAATELGETPVEPAMQTGAAARLARLTA